MFSGRYGEESSCTVKSGFCVLPLSDVVISSDAGRSVSLSDNCFDSFSADATTASGTVSVYAGSGSVAAFSSCNSRSVLTPKHPPAAMTTPKAASSTTRFTLDGFPFLASTGDAAGLSTAFPHLTQNFAPCGMAAPQFWQIRSIALPPMRSLFPILSVSAVLRAAGFILSENFQIFF